VNDKGFGDYADGFVPQDSSFQFGAQLPGCTVGDDLTEPLGDPNEAMLATALYYQANNACPPASAASAKSRRTDTEKETVYLSESAGGKIATTGRTRTEDILDTSRDLRMPY